MGHGGEAHYNDGHTRLVSGLQHGRSWHSSENPGKPIWGNRYSTHVVQNYLRPRSFKVCKGDEYSEPHKLSYGVPQGSCSGANIFTCYCSLINTEVPESININVFADDHSLRKTFQTGNNNKKPPPNNY